MDLNLADQHFPDAIQIVDRFHAKQHLSDVGKASTARRATWPRMARSRHEQLTPATRCFACRLRPTPSQRGGAQLHQVHRDNRHRCATRVPRRRALHFHRVVEAAARWHRHSLQAHWHALDGCGVDAIIALRCCKLSGRFETSGTPLDHSDRVNHDGQRTARLAPPSTCVVLHLFPGGRNRAVPCHNPDVRRVEGRGID